MKWILSVLIVACFSNTFARDIFVGGAGASDSNPGTAAQPFATIQKAASVAVAGDVIKIRSGTYRETIVPANSGTTYQPDNGATVTVSGLNEVGDGGWTVHSGNIYKKSINLPVNGYNLNISNNTTIAANQVFKNGGMQLEARWPKINSPEEMFIKSKVYRGRLSTSNWTTTALTDPGLPNIPGGWVGAKLYVIGWFIAHTVTVTSHSGTTIGFNSPQGDLRFHQYYYLTGKLGALTQAKEWHYENGTLYFWQDGGGSPTGVEYKARNWGFDLRGKANTSIIGLNFIGCEAMVGDANSSYTVLDGIRSKYQNHTVLQEGSDVIYYNPKQTGIKLIGPNSTVKNSEFDYAASQSLWLGQNCIAENNLFQHIDYEANYGSPIGFWDRTGGAKVLRNTLMNLGRSGIDLGGYITLGQHLNLEIAHNDIHHFSMLHTDAGGTYAGRMVDLTGTRIHHNWIHDNLAVITPVREHEVGVNGGIYFDQATGPTTVDHNVLWNNYQVDYCIENYNSQRNAGPSKVYNNTFATSNQPSHNWARSYLTHTTDLTRADIQRNNIYRDDLFFNWTTYPSAGNVQSCLINTQDPSFVGSGGGGLNYRLNSVSSAINAGVIIPGITDGSVGAPDIGAYEYGGENWVPGYSPQTTVPPTNTPPVVSITAPTNNASIAAGTAITISANASDANGSVTKVEFFDGTTKLGEDASGPYSFGWNNAPAGAHTITVRATDNNGAVTTSAPVSITVSTNAAPNVSITAPANNASFNAGASITITATATDANGSITNVEFFDGTTKLGEDATSPYSFVWNGAAAGTHNLTARATDNASGTATSTAITITVGAANTPPVVSLTSPANNTQFTVGSSINLTATASDANGSVTKVEFFSGTTKLGEDLTSPYTFAWNNATAGTHSITARATDNGNLVTTSAVINVIVAAAINTPPVVTLTSPTNNAQFTAGSPITLTATASDPNGTVTKVEFFDGTTKLGEDLTGPYMFVWNNATTGTHSVTARATDNGNGVTTSTAINVTVAAPINTPPVVTLTAPTNNAKFTPGSPITLTATASDPNGTVTKVEFFDGTTKLGEDRTGPYTFAWSNAAEGIHVITVKATDNGNVVTTSAPITITVTASTNTLPVVSITAPLNNAQFISGSAITITATASDANGTVTKVEFFDGTTKIGEDLTSPYSFIWTNVALGSHALSARATDNLGDIASSTAINISVADPERPTVEAGEDLFLTLPENSATLDPSVSSDVPVEYNWTQIEGPNVASISDPTGQTLNVSGLIEGTYVFELSVTNANGLTSTDRISIAVAAATSSPTVSQSGIPRFFSPNDDGTGDYWEWSDVEPFENSLLVVYNRSGQKIYEALSYNNTWDGKMEGQPLQAGDYYYIIQMADATDIKGAVRIIR